MAATVPDLTSYYPKKERASYQVAHMEDKRNFPLPEIPENVFSCTRLRVDRKKFGFLFPKERGLSW